MSLTDKTLPAPDPTQRQVVQSYGPGRFRVSGVAWTAAILVTPDRTVAWEAAAAPMAEALGVAALAPVLDATPAVEVLLVGGGARAAFIPPATRAALKARGLAVESMDTGAACRTYNVLLAEGRRVAAALIPTPDGA